MPRISTEDAGRWLNNVPDEYVFRCRDGKVFKNMQELEQALVNMTDESFAFHVDDHHNDFHNWVRDIIKDEKLARDLAKSRSRSQATVSVSRRLAFLRDRLQ
ncbi:MAG: hypothetical protein IBX68_03620 [Dehalococcoidia bacterium]|nr:hypothetical protein [Dehalococcoidia bacterium]